MADQEFKHIVRVANSDLDGNKNIVDSLRKVKGVSFMLANALCNLAGIPQSTKTGHLTDAQVKKIAILFEDLPGSDLPEWMLNRRRDYESGNDMHLIGNDLTYQHAQDKKRLQRIKSYKGLRHAVGLPVRGQRTQANFRKNKGKKR